MSVAGILSAAPAGRSPPVAEFMSILQSNGDDDPFLLFLFLFGGGLFAIYWGWTRYRRYRLIRDTPTAKARSMAVGRAEIEGTARPAADTFSAPFSTAECLYADWQVEEYQYDPDDNDHDWVTVASGELRTPFYVEDDTGRVLVRADKGADFDLSHDHRSVTRVGGSESPPAPIEAFIEAERGDRDLTQVLGGAVGSVAEVFTDDGRIGHSGNRRRYTQTLLPVGESTYVFGSAQPVPIEAVPDRTAGANEDLLAIEADGGTGMFIVSDRKEESLKGYYSKMAPLAIFAGLAASAVGLYFILSWYIFV